MKKAISILITLCILLPLAVVPTAALDTNDQVNPTSSSGSIVNDACAFYGIEASTCTTETIAWYIAQQPQVLAEVYSLVYPDREDTFAASSVELQLPVYIVSMDQPGVYLDFNGDNGYLILTNISDIIAWKATGDLSELKELDSTYYSTADGFGYYENNQFIPYHSNIAPSGATYPCSSQPYAGQELAGDGAITDTAAYIQDRYGSGYSIMSGGGSRSLTNFPYFLQRPFSVYDFTNDNGALVGEGNCGLTSMFVLLNYLQSSGKCPSLPSSSVTHNIIAANDPFFATYAANSSYSINSPLTVPFLYAAIRQYAIDNYNYQTGALATHHFDETIEAVTFGSSINATHHLVWSFESQIQAEITAGRPVIFTVENSATYGDHAVVVNGYRIYVKESTVLGVTVKDYVYLMKLNDNWSTTGRYFDLSAFGSPLSFCITVTY